MLLAWTAVGRAPLCCSHGGEQPESQPKRRHVLAHSRGYGGRDGRDPLPPWASSELLPGVDSSSLGVSRFIGLCLVKFKELLFDRVPKLQLGLRRSHNKGHTEAGGILGAWGCQDGAEGFR